MIAGISGHQDLGSKEQVNWISLAIAGEIAAHGITTGYSCLARGADQLFAEMILASNLNLVAVIPSAHYETTFKDETALQMYQSQKERAFSVIQLQHQDPTEEAFYDASIMVVNQSQMLIAVWNNKPAAGLGGTADVVAYAKHIRKHIIHINPLDQTIHRYL